MRIDSPIANPHPQSLPRWERETKPCSLRGKGRDGGKPPANYPPPNIQRGFTLIELIIVIIIIAVLAGLFLSRVPYYQEQAEKAAMQQVAGAVQSALVLRYGTLLARGAANEKELNIMATDNPMDWLQQKPPNYKGAFYDPSPRAVAPGSWMFDLKSRDLIYVPDHNDNFKPDKEGKQWIRFHTRFQYDPRLGGGEGKELVGTLFEPVETYHWFG